MNLVIHTQNNNISEREYIIDEVIGKFIGIPYELRFDSPDEYIIDVSGKEIRISDCFFGRHVTPLDYLKAENLPNIIYGKKNEFSTEEDVVILYGKDAIETNSQGINCGIDIFASVFFMLTRWEEYVVDEKDAHGRFIGKNSLAFKNGFLNRPVVNEYCELLWKMLSYLGYSGKRKERSFSIIPTHDIDHFAMENRYKKVLRGVASALLKKHDVASAAHKLKWIFSDPYDNMLELARISEEAGWHSHFYMMSADPSIKTMAYSKWLRKKKFSNRVHEVQMQGHIVGFHPGYFTMNDEEQLRKEKSLLESTIDFRVTEGRHHFLRVSLPESMAALERCGMKIDSSLGYADAEGFRCGTGDSFFYFDFLNRRRTNLLERPLAVMDGTLSGYQRYDLEQIKNVLEHYIEMGKRYKMTVTLLFHNSSFADRDGEKLMSIYRQIL